MKYYLFSEKLLELLLIAGYNYICRVKEPVVDLSFAFPTESCFVFEAYKEDNDKFISLQSHAINEIKDNDIALVRYLLQVKGDLAQLLESAGIESVSFEKTESE